MKRVGVFTLLAILGAAGQTPLPRSSTVAPSSPAHVAFARLPLRFEPNVGQSDPRVRFLSQGPGYRLFLTPTELVFSLQRGPSVGAPRTEAPSSNAQIEGGSSRPTVLRTQFVGARASPEVQGERPLRGKSHYFRGSEPTRWQTNVPQFERVVYRELWEGVDLALYGTRQGELESDFIVAPGGDPNLIRLAFDGAQSMRLDEEGALVLEMDGGTLLQHRPFLYQEQDGKRQEVQGSWVLGGHREARVMVASYDREKPLVIDPVLEYSSYLGGSESDFPHSVALASENKLYIAGTTHSTDFPSAGTPYQGTNAGLEDVFVVKLDLASGLEYSTYLGGTGRDRASDIAVDAQGNAYVTGNTGFSNFPTAGTPYQSTNAGNLDAFVAILGPTSELVYSTYLGGGAEDVGTGIAPDGAGGAWVTGGSGSTNFPTTPSAFQQESAGSYEVFVARVDPTNGLTYSTLLGGSGYDRAHAMALGPGGDVYVTGSTSSGDFPLAGPPSQPSFGGGSEDGFVARVSETSGLVYSTYLGGGAGQEYGQDIAVDGSGHAYVTGRTISTDFPTAGGPFQMANAGESDAFVTELGPTSALVYSTLLGGDRYDYGHAIAVDDEGTAYVTGLTFSSGFPTAGPPFQPEKAGHGDAFVSKLSPSDGLLYSTFLGGRDEDGGHGIVLDASGNAYVVGDTQSDDYPTGGAAHQTVYRGERDGFVAKLFWDNGTADLGVEKWNGLSQVAPGQFVTYTIEVTNLGPDPVTEAAATDAFSSLLQNVTWSCSASVGSACGASAGSGDISTTVSLLVGGVATFSATGKVDPEASGSLVNTAIASVPHTFEDPDADNNSATDIDAILVIPTVDVRVNGIDAVYPDFVTTQNPIQVSLNMTAGPRALDHYFYFWYGGTYYWVTPGGISAAPAPLTTFAPVDLTGIVLMESPLATGAWAFGWIMIDGTAVVGWDAISVLVTP